MTLTHRILFALQVSLAWVTTSFADPLGVKEIEVMIASYETNSNRCGAGIQGKECSEEREFALIENLITRAAYDRLVGGSFYPTFNARGKKIQAVCKCGCLAKGTMISMPSDEEIPIQKIKKDMETLALAKESTLTNPELVAKRVHTISKGPEEPQLYVFHLANDRTIKASRHHGMLLSSGIVKAAEDVSANDSFVDRDGQKVDILKITREKAKGDVYNFAVASEHKSEHFIVAEGILVGDLSWQNEHKGELGAIQIRR